MNSYFSKIHALFSRTEVELRITMSPMSQVSSVAYVCKKVVVLECLKMASYSTIFELSAQVP